MPVVDLVRLAELPAATDPGWLEWLTAGELAGCHGLARAQEHQAARLAGKRALAGLLGLRWPPPWQLIEIGRAAHRPPR